MRPLRLVSTAVLTASLLGAGVARADPPWSAPVPIASGIDVGVRPALAFTGDGHALATLDAGVARILAADPGASQFAEIGRTVLLARPSVYGRRGVAYLRTPPPPRGQAIHNVRSTRLGASLGMVPGSLGRFQLLARVTGSPIDLTARIAADPRGNVAAAWLEPRGRRTLVRVALRRPGRAFGRATTLGVATPFGDVTPLDLSYGANGDLVVAFQRTRSQAVDHRTLRLAVRVKRSGGRFGPIQSLGPLLGSSSVATVVGPTGRAVVAWGTQDAGEGVEDPWTVRAAILRSGASRFSRTQLLDPGRVARPVADVSAAIGRDGTATVVWSGVAARGPRYPVRVATARTAGRFGTTAQLAPNGAALGVVTAPDTTTTVLWGSLSDPEAETLDQILAARRPPRMSHFAAAEAVSAPQPARNHGSIALDRRSGRVSALWIGSPGTPSGELLQNESPVEPLYSTRSG